MEGFKVTVIDSSKEMSKKEMVMAKDVSDAKSLEELSRGTALVFKPDYYVALQVHNEYSDNKDYNVFVVVDTEGVKYKTSSQAFWAAFIDIMEDMEDSDEEFAIKVYQLPSKNNAGNFVTCSII